MHKLGWNPGDIYLNSISAWLFGFVSVFSFFPFAGFPDHEIFPYYVFFGAAATIGRRAGLVPKSGVVGLFLSAFGLLAFFSVLPFRSPATTDALQLFVVGLALFFYTRLDFFQIKSFDNGLFMAVFFAVALMGLQKVFPPLIDLSYSTLVNRDGYTEEILLYSGGVPGYAPEPAYMAAFLIGAFLYFRRCMSPPIRPALAAVGVVLTGSLSGILVLCLVGMLTVRPLLTLCFVFVLSIGMGFAESINALLAARVQNFAFLLREGGLSFESMVSLDEAFGSLRLFTLVEPLSALCCGAPLSGVYHKSFSPFAVTFNLLAPLHLAFLFLVFCFAPKTRFAVVSLILFLTFGPVLNWLGLVGFVGGQKAVIKHKAIHRSRTSLGRRLVDSSVEQNTGPKASHSP